MNRASLFLAAALSFASVFGHAQPRLQAASKTPKLLHFSPHGEVAKVRQVVARFSEPMTAFGDPLAQAPFAVDCQGKGQSRWADPTTWVYDFEQDLPAGIACTFKTNAELNSLAGKPVLADEQYRFTTGGPKLVFSRPFQEDRSLKEDQAWLLGINAPADRESVAKYATCRVAEETRKVVVLGDEERNKIVEQYGLKDVIPASVAEMLALKCEGKLPTSAPVSLVWGKDIRSANGVGSEKDQTFSFAVRGPLAFNYRCGWQANAGCPFDQSIYVGFTAPVPRSKLESITLTLPDGKVVKPKSIDFEVDFLNGISFPAPFPPQSVVTLHIPAGIRDDSGRPLDESVSRTRDIYIGDVPPEIRFAAPPNDIAVLERKLGGIAPVTLQNVETELPLKIMKLPDDDREIVRWLERFRKAYRGGSEHDSLLDTDSGLVEQRTLRKQHGERAREVLGIELGQPGLYLLETSSMRMRDTTPSWKGHFVSAALVTNLALHFRRSWENALVWVTTLDTGTPVAGADVRITACDGNLVWQGVTDADGLARIPADKVSPKNRPCTGYSSEHLITARFAGDFSMATSYWGSADDYHLSGHVPNEPPLIAHTVLDRSLFRAGETVSMKHFLRQPTGSGFAIVDQPVRISLWHMGNNRSFDVSPESRPGTGTATSQWRIPADAPLGTYRVAVYPESGRYYNVIGDPFSEFRVEEFRVPTMKAEVLPPREEQIAPKAVPLGLSLNYLAGGGVQQRVYVKAALGTASVRFPGYADFRFDTHGSAEGEHPRHAPDRTPYRTIGERLAVALNADGRGIALIDKIPAVDRPTDLIGEMEFADANGEIQTVSASVRLWPAAVLLGVKAASWVSVRTPMPLEVVALGPDGKALKGVAVTVDGRLTKTAYKRIRAGDGQFRYQSSDSVSDLPGLCSRTTDELGLLRCSLAFTESGQLSLRASATDIDGRVAVNTHSATIFSDEAGSWRNSQAKLEVLPDKHRYADGETAKVQVRVPFAPSTALIAVEREGVFETWVRHFKNPVESVEIPVKGRYAPNMYISVVAVSGRSEGDEETMSADDPDPGRPRFKLGRAEIEILPDAFKLDVKVSADQASYRTRDKAKARIEVRRADGRPLPAGAEVALAVVDEALLQLAPNPSWDILSTMLHSRNYGVQHATTSSKLAIKPAVGLVDAFNSRAERGVVASAAKYVSSDPEESASPVRQLFDTLLLWRGSVFLDADGRATVEVPLNDSLSEFRIVAVAQAGADLFGFGDTRIRSTKPLQILAGLPQLVREGDAFTAQATLRNTSNQALTGEFVAHPIRFHEGGSTVLPEQRLRFTLAANESAELSWPVRVPVNTARLEWVLDARSDDGPSDALKTAQNVAPAVPVTVRQATLAQLKGSYALPVERPADAVPGVGGLEVSIVPKLGETLSGVSRYMRDYPHACLEQRVSIAIATRDLRDWQRIISRLESYLDREGLAKYWPGLERGSEILTAYVLSISRQAGWRLPASAQHRMLAALENIAHGHAQGHDLFPRDDGTVRKLIVLEALSRYERVQPDMLAGLQAEPNRWPTSAVIDWLSILNRQRNVPDRVKLRGEAENVLRARMDMHGTTLNFSTERDDYWWWYMVSPDQNAVRAVLVALNLDGWREDLPRMVRGALLKRKGGHWQTTTANAWGVLAMEAFSNRFEVEPVKGLSRASLASSSKSLDWNKTSDGGTLSFDWPQSPSTLDVVQKGTGRPWIMVQSRAAVPLKMPLSSGYRISKTIEVLERKHPGVLSKGDVARVTLTVDAQSDMTWVALSDPVPAGATILSRGLARDSQLATSDEKRQGWVWPSHEEKGFDAFRAYYRYVPKGKFSVSYTVRFNNEGEFALPQTRVEAMYAPEMFGETPNRKIKVQRQ